MNNKIIMRKKKPKFIRQDTHRAKKFQIKWRKPKGMHSKLRLNKKGHQKSPSQGYRAPKKIRIIKPFLIYTLKDLDNKSGIIASRLGIKKKIELLKKAKEKKVDILNVKDIDAFIKNAEDEIKKRKEKKKHREERKKKSKEEVEKKKETKKKDEEEEKKEISKKLATDVKQKPVEIIDKSQKTQQVHRATAPKQK